VAEASPGGRDVCREWRESCEVRLRGWLRQNHSLVISILMERVSEYLIADVFVLDQLPELGDRNFAADGAVPHAASLVLLARQWVIELETGVPNGLDLACFEQGLEGPRPRRGGPRPHRPAPHQRQRLPPREALVCLSRTTPTGRRRAKLLRRPTKRRASPHGVVAVVEHSQRRSLIP